MPIPAAAENPRNTAATREPSLDLELPESSDEDMVEIVDRERERTSMQLKLLNFWLTIIYSVSPEIDLPDVGILWQPEFSTKVPVSFRVVQIGRAHV